MTTFNTNMFQSIKAALTKNEEKATPGLYNEILKTVPGNTYTVRLLPFAKDPSKTFFHYYIHGWTSFSSGQYVQAVSPQTFNERDPISEERFRVLRTGTETEKEKMQAVRRTEKWLVNVYVVEDPTNPENNGTVKMLRYGKQLQKIIMEAIEGEDADEFGPRIFDLGTEGVNLKVKVEQQGDYPTYVSSRFTSSGKLNLSEEEREKIYKNTFNLEEVFTIKTYDELKQMMDEHIYVTGDSPVKSEPVTPAARPSVTPTPAVARPATAPITESTIEDEINELLKDL
jgi:hypothetical protein